MLAQFTIKDENHGDCKNSTSSHCKKKGADSKKIGAGRILHLTKKNGRKVNSRGWRRNDYHK